MLTFAVRHVPCVHLGLEFGDFLICYVGGFAVVIVRVLKEHREEVFDGLAFAVPHRVHCSEDGFGDELVRETVALAVATDDAVDFPEAKFVEDFMARAAYLSNKELVYCPRRCQFFPFVPFSPFGSSPSGNLYHSANILVISTNASVSSSLVA